VGRSHDTVSFLTDYGLDDEFVGVVKSVIRDMAPHVTVVDLTHGIRPFDVRGGSLALARAIPYVAEGIVLAVVDPGVGTSRRALAIEVAGGAGVFIGPDNGLLAPAVAVVGGAERAVELTNPEHHLTAAGATFAGRDVFAPVAAHLCNGVDLAELGPLVDAAELMPGMLPLPREEPDGFHTEVLWVDRFGNCQSTSGPSRSVTSAAPPSWPRRTASWPPGRSVSSSTRTGCTASPSTNVPRPTSCACRPATPSCCRSSRTTTSPRPGSRRRCRCAAAGSVRTDAPRHHPRDRPVAARDPRGRSDRVDAHLTYDPAPVWGTAENHHTA
jgi:S-adenosylmethionine hydrolase